MAEPPPIRKFTFNKSFDMGAAAPTRGAERKPVTLSPDQFDALKKETYDAGVAAGQKMAADSLADQAAQLLLRIESNLTKAVENMHAMHAEFDTKARQIAVSVVRKMMPDLAAKNGLQEIEAMLSTAIAEMLHEPRLVVRVHESQFDSINTKVQDIAAQKAYAGKVVVLADADIAAGDCRIEWADGGMERNTNATWTEVEKVVAPAEDPLPTPNQE